MHHIIKGPRRAWFLILDPCSEARIQENTNTDLYFYIFSVSRIISQCDEYDMFDVISRSFVRPRMLKPCRRVGLRPPHLVQQTKYFKLEVLVERGGNRENPSPRVRLRGGAFLHWRFCFARAASPPRRVCVLYVKPVLTPVDMVYSPLFFVYYCCTNTRTVLYY